MGTRHIRGLDETIDTSLHEKSDPNLITATKAGSKRGLDVSIQSDFSSQSETVPLLRSIESILMRIEEHLEIVTDEKLG